MTELHKFTILKDNAIKIEHVKEHIVVWGLDGTCFLSYLNPHNMDLELGLIYLSSSVESPTFKLPIENIILYHIEALYLKWNFTYSLIKINEKLYLTNQYPKNSEIILENIIQTNIDEHYYFLTSNKKLFRFSEDKKSVILMIEHVRDMYIIIFSNFIITNNGDIYKLQGKNLEPVEFY
jgi:hypothetical protein